MQIRYTTLEKMSKLTNREMDFFLYILRYQDENGIVQGVYYKDVCSNKRERFSMCKQTFYNTLRSLKEKAIIMYEQNIKGDYDITIIGNRAYNIRENAPYININREIFRNRGFQKMKAKEKFMLLDFMRLTTLNRGIFVIGKENFYKKYKEILGVSKRIVRMYLHALRKHFMICMRAGKYYIHFVAARFVESTVKGSSAKGQYREYMVRVVARRAGLKREPGQKDIVDLGTLVAQYAARAEEKGYDIFRALKICIEQSAAENRERLKPSYIHMLLKRCIEE